MKAVNLIPSEQRAGASTGAGASEGGAYMVLGLIVGLAVIALLYGSARHQVSTRKHEAANLTAQAQAAQARANELAPYTSFKQMAAQREQAVSQLVDTRFDWAHALHELGRVLPKDASLSSVHGTIGSGAAAAGAAPASGSTTVTSATPPGSTPEFTLAGCATSQSEVAQTLQRLRLIDGVSNVELQSSTKSESGSSGSGSCPPHAPAFTVQIAFDGLPAPSTASGGAASQPTAGASTTPPGGAQ